MLPHELEVTTVIAAKYRIQLAAMNALHNLVVEMLSGGMLTITKPRGLKRFVVETVVGLLVKACKTYRAIQSLCERGLHDDAQALVRVLMETTVAIHFILQKKSIERALIYHAHGIAQSIKMLNEWKQTKGLKRKATATHLAEANAGLAAYLSKLPPGTNVKKHWSGKASLQEAVIALKGNAMYATLYRHTSSISHGSDFGNQVEFDPATGHMIWQIEPTVDGFEAPTYAARELLLNAATRIDDRLGLGFASRLAWHKLTRKGVNEGLK